MQNNDTSIRQVEALLDFYLASGVDSFPGSEPVDWFERSKTISMRPAMPVPPVAGKAAHPEMATGAGQPGQPPMVAPRLQRQTEVPGGPQSHAQPGRTVPRELAVPDEQVVAAAGEAAASAASLDGLRACLEAFEGCNLKQTAKKLVFADGNPQARIMFIGEAPGRDEDIQGLPFVGRSGQLLDRMLKAVGLDRKTAYIANVVPWRPPGNRTPTPQETEICKPFIRRQIELVDPDILVFLGAASAKSLLGVQDGIRRLRGRWMQFPSNGREIAAIATYHPAYLLRSPLEKRLSWRDFQAIKLKLADREPDGPEP